MAGHRGTVTTARAALGDESPEVRSTALGALARMETIEPGDLTRSLADADPGVRRRAAEVAGRSQGLAPHVPDLRPLLADPSPEVVEMVAWALGEGGDPDAIAPLALTARQHSDPLCREAAVAALGAISAGTGLQAGASGSAEALAAILESLGDRPAVRRRAVLALVAFEGPEVDEALHRALTDRDWQVRQAAEDLLAT